MAGSDKIKKDDVLGGIANELQKLISSVNETKKANDELIISQKKLLESFKGGTSKEIKELYKAFALLNATLQQNKKLAEQEIKLKERLSKVNGDRLKLAAKEADLEVKSEKLKREKLKTFDKEIQSEVKLAKAIREEAREKERAEKIAKKALETEKKLASAYTQAEIKLKKLRDEYKDLAVKREQGIKLEDKEIKKLDELQKEITELDKILKKVDADTGQFQRNVGNYTEAVSSLTGQFGSLGSKIDGVADSIRDLGGAFGKLGPVAKAGLGPVAAIFVALSVLVTKIQSGIDDFKVQLSGIGGALDVIAGRIGLLGQAIVQAFKGNFAVASIIATNVTTGLSEAINKAFEEGKKLAELEINLEEDLIKSKVAVEELTQAMEDAQRRADDATLSFSERDKQSRISLENELKLRELQFELAKKAYYIERIRTEADRKAGTLKRDQLEAEANAQVALLKAEDDLGDAREINDQANRERLQKQLKNQIDGIKAVTEIQLDELKKQIANEKLILDERLILLDDFESKSKETFQKELNDINKLTGFKLDQEKLIQEAQKGTLDAYIKTLDVQNKFFGDKAQDALRTAVVERLKSINEVSSEANKIAEERIKIQKELNQLEQERLQILEQRQIDELESLANDRIQVQETIQEEILKSENVFNKSLLQQRKTLHEETMILLEEEFKERQKLLKLQFEADIAAVDSSSDAEEVKDAKKRNIQEKYNSDVISLEKQKNEKIEAENQKDVDNTKAVKEKQLQIIHEYADGFINALDEAFQESVEKQEKAFDKQIEKRESNIEKQQELFERGAENQLAFEEAQLAKEELMKQQAAKKNERTQQFLALVKAYSAYVEQDPNTALNKALADIAEITVAKTLFAATGAENIQGPGTETSDSIPARLSKGESVLTAKATKEFSGFATAANKGIGTEWLLNEWLGKTVNSNYGTDSFGQNITTAIGLQQISALSGIDKRLQSLEKAIIEKPETNFEIDGLLNVTKSVRKAGLTKKTTYISSNKRLG